jgi:hypothetical protein
MYLCQFIWIEAYLLKYLQDPLPFQPIEIQGDLVEGGGGEREGKRRQKGPRMKEEEQEWRCNLFRIAVGLRDTVMDAGR